MNAITKIAKIMRTKVVRFVNGAAPDDTGNVDLSYMARLDKANNFSVRPTVAGEGIMLSSTLSLGGRNYIQDSGFELGTTKLLPVATGYGGTIGTGGSTYPKPFGSKMLIFSKDQGTGAGDYFAIVTFPAAVHLSKGETWTYSYSYATAASFSGAKASNFLLTSADSTAAYLGTGDGHFTYQKVDQTVWVRWTKSFTAASDTDIAAARFGAVSSNTGAGWLCIDNVQLEKSSQASDYRPAYEDFQTQLDALKAKS